MSLIITYNHRLLIEKRIKEGNSMNNIAKEIGVTRQTVYRELLRSGTKENGFRDYNADEAQRNIGIR